jgi:hypothetical protein
MKEKPEMKDNVPYLLGYTDKTSSRRTLKSIYGSIAGLVVGGALLFLL